ncbi:MAG: hypothetical protein JSV03_01190, partial [Planctomycetota bacterium]
MLPVRLFRNGTENWLERPFGSLARWADFVSMFDRVCGTDIYGGLRVDIHEDGDNTVIEAEVPGLSKKDIEITTE